MPIPENKISLISANQTPAEALKLALKNTAFEKNFTVFQKIETQTSEFEITFLDLPLINEKSIELLRELKDRFEFTPIIIISNQISDDEGSFLIKNGAYYYLDYQQLTKPEITRAIITCQNARKISQKWQTAFISTKEKESNLRTILNNVEDAIVLIDAEAHIIDYNKITLDFFDRVFKTYPQINSSIFDFFAASDKPAFWEGFVKSALKGSRKIAEINIENEVVYRVTAHPVIDENKVIGASINALNITDYIKAQREKELREANLKSLIQNTYDPMWSIDTSYKLIAFNSAYEDLASQYLGRPPVMGDSVLFETYSDELEKNWEKSYDRALKGERFEEEMVYNYVGGNLYIENEFNPIRNTQGEIIGVTCFSRDVTERRQQEEKNKEFASIVKFSNDAIIGFTIDGTIESWNPAATKMLGYKDYEAIGKKTQILFSGSEYQMVTQRFVSFLKGNPIEQFVQKMITKNEVTIDAAFSFSLHQDSEGKVTKASAIVRDITEQLKAERELIEQQHFIESITETSPSILYVYDFYQGKTIYINKRASELLGYNREEIRAFEEGIYEIVHPDDKKNLVLKNKKLLHSKDGVIVEQDYRVRHKKGHYIWLNARNTIFRRFSNGKVQQILGTARDISVQKKTENELEQLSLFAKHTHNYLVISNKNNEIEFVNEAFTKHLGYSLREIEGKSIESVLSGPKTNKETLNRIHRLIEQKKSINEEIIFYKKSGEPYWAGVYKNPVFDENGELKNYLQVQIDISAQKRNEELTLQAKELAEKNAKFKDEFLANMSHEIRTPLNGIIGMIDILEDTKLDDEQKHYIDTFKNSSNSLLEIINNILDLSKLEAGKMEMKPIDFELNNTLNNVKSLYTPIANSKGIKLEIIRGKNVPRYINTDENKLVQIVSNLLSNAIKFTEKGSVTIEVSKNKKESSLLFEIKDTGIGINEENLNVLFKKFSQIDQSAGKRFAGTGLGLAISRELTSLFGGKIGVSSKLNEGSNFWFTLNYNEVKHPERIKEKQQKGLKIKNENFNLNVLLVDDQPINREVATLMLEHFGCTVEQAENGEDCLKKYQPNKFQVVLMDIQMPVMDGVEATKTLRLKHKNLPPIIAVSANAMEGDAEKYIAAGLDDYLPKPITKETIYNLLNKHFGKSKTNKATTPIVQPKQEDFPILKDEILNSLKAMGNEEVLKSLFKSFINDANQLVEEINTHLKSKNYQELRKANHTINGLSGTIGAIKMNKVCIAISTAIKEENFKDLPNIIHQLNHTHQELIQHINEKVIG